MKIAVIIVGILGALALGALGSKWVTDYNDNKQAVVGLAKLAHSLGGKGNEVEEAIKGVERLKTAGYLMMLFALVSLGASVMVGKLGKISGGALLASALIPAVLAPASLLAGFLLIIAGVLGLFVKTKPRPASLTGAVGLAA
jgi:hypothetical protein